MGLVLHHQDCGERQNIVVRTEWLESWIIIASKQKFRVLLHSTGILKSSCLCTAQACMCEHPIFSWAHDDIQGRRSDQNKWVWMRDKICAKINILCCPLDDSSKRGAGWGIGGQKHMLWQFTRSVSMHAEIKWYAAAGEPFSMKTKSGH